jgi:hypothetical protein
MLVNSDNGQIVTIPSSSVSDVSDMDSKNIGESTTKTLTEVVQELV